MKLSVPLGDGLCLTIADQSETTSDYPTRRLQKGLLLRDGEQDLAEEGVGFGVPILKRGAQTIFPGSVELTASRTGADWEVTAVYAMDLVERLGRPGGASLRSGPLYAIKDALAAAHRRVPALRGPLTALSAALRRVFRWSTVYERTATRARIRVRYAIDASRGRIGVRVETAGLPREVSEVVVMNELGAHFFDRYTDADGADLRGAAVGTWDAVTAPWARFASTTHKVAFSLARVEGARLSRGRELIGSRLAWAGFGYALAPLPGAFVYEIHVARTP